MDTKTRQQLEKEYHESEDKARAENKLISGIYAADPFAEAESYQLDALGDIRGAHVLDYGCGSGWSSGLPGNGTLPFLAVITINAFLQCAEHLDLSL